MMEGNRNRLTTYNDRRSILRDSYQSRVKFSTVATSTGGGATQRHKRCQNNNSDGQSLDPSYIVSPVKSKFTDSPKSTDPLERNKERQKKIKKKIVITVLVSILVLLLVLGESSNNNILSSTLDEEIDFSMIDGNSEIQNNHLMTRYTSNEKDGYQPRRRETSPEQSSYGNTLSMNQNKEPQNLIGMAKSTDIDSAASQLVDAIRRSEEGANNVQLKITVNEEKDDLPLRKSGLRISPGVPLPNQKLNMSRKRKKIFKPTNKLLSRIKTSPHQIANLNCALYNGPEYSVAKELVYWEDIPSDSSYEVAFFHNSKKIDEGIKYERDSFTKYLTFQPDTGGFNNNRMAFETALVLSISMGRTLVLPPEREYPLMSAGSRKDNLISLDNIFHLDSLNKEYESVNIISMEEFIIREGISPAKNTTDWDGSLQSDALWEYLETIANVPKSWNRNECVVAFPSTNDVDDNKGLIDILNEIMNKIDGRLFPHHLDYQGKPMPSNAPTIERLREILAGRSKLCLYTDEMESSPIIHLPTKPPHQRLLTHFYSFVFFEDWAQNTWTNRLVRDHLRYSDEIMCAAARVIEAIRQSSYSRINPSGIYHSLHIRRKDFHPRKEKFSLSPNDVLQSLSDVEPGSVIFFATDDYDENFFEVISEKYQLYSLENFLDLVQGLNPNYFGMVEQVIAARAESFHGTFYSTFSSYISRLRGYYNTRDNLEGSQDGVLPKTYYMPSEYRNENRIYKALQKPFFSREFPIAWRDIDSGIDQINEAHW